MKQWPMCAIALTSDDGSAIALATAIRRRFAALVAWKAMWTNRDRSTIDELKSLDGYLIFVADSSGKPDGGDPRWTGLGPIVYDAGVTISTRFVGDNIEATIVLNRYERPGQSIMALLETDSEKFNRALKCIQDGATGDERTRLLEEMTEAARNLDAKRDGRGAR